MSLLVVVFLIATDSIAASTGQADAGTLRLFVFHDSNANGFQDTGEPPMQGVFIEASSPCGQSQSGETDQDGLIVWDNVCADFWTVTETVPADAEPTTPTTVVTSVQSQEIADVIFGNRYLGNLEILKFEDLNGDGQHQVNDEPPWSGVTINWVSEEINELGSCITDDQGYCHLTDLPVGEYIITEILPPNSTVFEDIQQTAIVRWGVTLKVEFANRKLGDLEILKYEDLNGNGVARCRRATLAGCDHPLGERMGRFRLLRHR